MHERVITGYVIARPPGDDGRHVVDWDDVVYDRYDVGVAQLREAHGRGYTGYRLYGLTPIDTAAPADDQAALFDTVQVP